MSDTPPRPNPAQFLPRRVERTPGDFGRGHLKVDNLLKEEDRDAYLALLRQPGTTGRKAWQWLRDKGYVVGPGAVKHHKRRFDQQLREVRTSAEMSLVCADLVRQVGVNRMSDAAVLRFEALLTEHLFHKYKHAEKIDPKEWETLGRALTAAVTNRTKVEKTRIEGEGAKRGAERDSRANRTGRLDGAAMSEKVRRILGVPLPGEPIPGLPPRALPAPPSRNPSEEEQETIPGQERQDSPHGGDCVAGPGGKSSEKCQVRDNHEHRNDSDRGQDDGADGAVTRTPPHPPGQGGLDH